jgi:hypothetical protein
MFLFPAPLLSAAAARRREVVVAVVVVVVRFIERSNILKIFPIVVVAFAATSASDARTMDSR